MDVFTKKIGDREFLIAGTSMVPVDRIRRIDLDAPNGGCDNSVRVYLGDPDEEYIWAYENADAVRAFLTRPGSRSAGSPPGED